MARLEKNAITIDGLSKDAEKNRAAWDEFAKDYVSPGERTWATTSYRWKPIESARKWRCEEVWRMRKRWRGGTT